MKFYLVCYDTSSDKRRRKMSKYLVNYLVRIQGSVFEGYLKDGAFAKLKRSLDRIVKEEEDLLRIYQLNEASLKNTIVYGSTPLVQRENYVLVSELEPPLKLYQQIPDDVSDP